jgi:nicotinate-nucleotide adenylyltransferase
MGPIGILGGTFDPVHFGHLRTGAELLDWLGLEELRFVPCRIPPHGKAPVATAAQRAAMLRAATAGVPGFVVDERELARAGPSYTVDTLESLRGELRDQALCLIIGMDSFVALPTWHRWRELPALAHLIVAHRPKAQPPAGEPLRELLDDRRTVDPADLVAAPAGRILLHEVTQLDISSRAIREMVAAGRSPRFLLPGQVLDMIDASGCYAPATRVAG